LTFRLRLTLCVAATYPNIPQPNAAVQTMEKATTMISHMSSFFMGCLPG
jgi:hypothetical protein